MPRFIGIFLLACALAAAPAWALEQPANPESGSDWYALARSLQDGQKYDDALAAYQQAIDHGFQPAGALMRMAQIEAARGDTASALARLEKATTIAPMVLSLLPQIGGIPELAGNPRFQALLASAEKARYPCEARAESRQFDFWLGDWSVTGPQGQVVGENHITRDHRGCVIRESWTDAYGDHGSSVNFFDPDTRHWHQVWTSDVGTVTHYEGEFRDGAMRFMANGFGNVDGKTHYRRMTFTPNADGSVRQLIEDSDDGKTWDTGFDGLYRKQATD